MHPEACEQAEVADLLDAALEEATKACQPTHVSK